MFRRKKTDCEKRDEAIEQASTLLHKAAGQLCLAHHYAAQMGDPGFADALWQIRDLIPAVTREVDAYLHDWAAIMQAPRHEPAVPVRKTRRFT
jgi:hypothetical protein